MKYPSKLTTFEQFLYFDDYPGYPNTIGCRLNLSGALDEQALLESARIVGRRNPLLNSTLKLQRGVPFWNHCHPEPCVSRLPDQFVGHPFFKRIDLKKEAGGQLHWSHAEEKSSVYLLTHHAAADGLGGLQVVFDWLIGYAALESCGPNPANELIAKAEAQMRRLDPSLLNRRASFRFCSWRFLKMIPRQLIGLFGVREFFANRPVALKPHSPVTPEQPIPDGYPGIYTKELGDIELVREQAGNQNVTSNELILQSVFIGLAKWRQKHQFGSDRDCLRIMVPINLRSIADRKLPASHRSSMVTLDRLQSDCLQDKKLLDSIRFQMNVIKTNELGLTFLHMLNLYRWFPRGLRRIADPNRVGATVVVTNLGEPFRRTKLPRNEEGKLIAGSQILDSVELIAPLRPNTQAAFAISRYAHKTFLTLTYDNRVLAESVAKELNDLVCEEFQARTSTDGNG